MKIFKALSVAFWRTLVSREEKVAKTGSIISVPKRDEERWRDVLYMANKIGNAVDRATAKPETALDELKSLGVTVLDILPVVSSERATELRRKFYS